MSSLTRDEAIREFRKMWNWIATESIKRKRKVLKHTYFKENNLPNTMNDCFLCEFKAQQKVQSSCNSICPIDFGKGSGCELFAPDSPYRKWKEVSYEDYMKASELARQIASLPEKRVCNG